MKTIQDVYAFIKECVKKDDEKLLKEKRAECEKVLAIESANFDNIVHIYRIQYVTRSKDLNNIDEFFVLTKTTYKVKTLGLNEYWVTIIRDKKCYEFKMSSEPTHTNIFNTVTMWPPISLIDMIAEYDSTLKPTPEQLEKFEEWFELEQQDADAMKNMYSIEELGMLQDLICGDRLP